MTTTTSVDKQHSLSVISNFLFHEVRLLDEQRFEEWFDLFDEDGHYWVPASWGQKSPLSQVSIYYEDRSLLKLRVMRLGHPSTENMRPAPRTLHQITNVNIDHIDTDRDEIHVYAALSVIDYRLNEQRLFAGPCRYILRRHRDDYKIVMKRVDLLNCDTKAGHVRMTIPF